MKNLTDFHTKVWICTWLLLYMLWSVVWLSPLRVAIKRLIQLSIIDDEHPPPPTSRDRMWYNWLWRVMQLLSRVCWKKVIFLLRIMLLYGAASLHWATTCWDPEGGKNRIKNSKSNIYRPFSGCAQWNVLPRGRVDLHQIYHVHYCSEINKDINNNKLNVL